MNYREKILEILESDDEQLLLDTIEGLDDWQQIDFWTMFKEVAKEISLEMGNENMDKMLNLFEQKIDDFREACVDEQVLSLKAELEMDLLFKQADKALDNIRLVLKDAIENNAPNAPELKAMAKGLMNIEIEHKQYKPGDWAWLKD